MSSNQKILALGMISVLVLISFQNCTQEGGQSAFGNLSSEDGGGTNGNTRVDCARNPSDPACEDPDGDANPTGLSVLLPTENPDRNSAESSFSISGACGNGNFVRNKIFWTLRLTQRNGSAPNPAVSTNSEARGGLTYKCVNNQYTIVIENSGNDGWIAFQPNDRASLEISIRGYDSSNIPYSNPPNDRVTLNLTFLPPGFAPLRPVLNSEALGIPNEFNDLNGAAPLRFFASAGSNTYTIRNLSGYCQYSTTNPETNSIRILLQDESVTTQDVLIGTTTCNPGAGSNPPNPNLNGTFYVAEIVIPDVLTSLPISPQVTSRQFKLWTRVTYQATNYDSEPKIKAQFRFHDAKGGGWTAQAAQEVLRRFKRFAEFNWDADVSYPEALLFVNAVRSDVTTNTGNGCQGGTGATAKYGLRCKVLEYFKLSEKAQSEGSVVSIKVEGNQLDTAGFINRIHRVGLTNPNAQGGFACNSALNLTRYNSYGVAKEDGSDILVTTPVVEATAKRQLQNIALCMLYHRDRVLGRSDSNEKYKTALEYGLRYRSIDSCRGNFNSTTQSYSYTSSNCGCYTGPNINNPADPTDRRDIETGACVRFLDLYDSSMRQYINGVQSQGLNLANNLSDQKVRDFYEMIAQRTINHTFGAMCDASTILGTGSNEFENSVVSKTVGNDMPDKLLYHYLEKTGVSATAQAFAVYSNDTQCGSRFANGNTIGGSGSSGGGGDPTYCPPEDTTLECRCYRNPALPLCRDIEPRF